MNKWYDQTGKDGDIVISSRVRLARNVKSYPFMDRIDAEQQDRLNHEIYSRLQDLNLGENQFDFLWIDSLSEDMKRSLVERHLASLDLMERGNNLLALSQDNSISIMVNEEDHLRIQVIVPGFDLEKAFETAERCDDFINESFAYAFDEKVGYLTTCMTNLGTGLRASVMLHLPALEEIGVLNNIAKTLSKLGLTIRGTYGEGTNAYGSVYQISNQITLGISEKQAIENLKNVVDQILANEKEARQSLLQKDRLKIEDRVGRSYGILHFARSISTEEVYRMLSDIRLGVSLKLLDGISYEKLNHLLACCGDSTLRVSSEIREPIPDGVRRANMIQSVLDGTSGQRKE